MNLNEVTDETHLGANTRMQVTIALSLVFHAIVIFYTPPDLFTAEFFSSSENEVIQHAIKITLYDEPSNTVPALNEDNNNESGNDKGSFSDVDLQKWGDLLERLEKNTGFHDSYKQVFEDLHSDGKISENYMHRDRQHEDIVVKEVFPTIYEIEKPFKQMLAVAPKTLNDYIQRNKIIEDYRQWSKGQSKPDLNISLNKEVGNGKGPLIFPKPQRADYFDNTLKNSKEAQLSNFIEKYIDHDPNEGDLPIAIRELYYDNLQRLVYSFSSDPTYLFLDYYLENLNKEDFLINSIYEAARLNGSKSQTELLFAIEDIYNIQQRAWSFYFNYEKIYEGQSAEKKMRLRNETLRRVTVRYKDVLHDKNVKNYRDIIKLYTKKRLEIMDYIIENTPQEYRVDDAQFERAAILWQYGNEQNDESRREMAVSIWLKLLNKKDAIHTAKRSTSQIKKSSQQSELNDSENLSAIVLSKLDPFLQIYQQRPITLRRDLQNKIQNIILTRYKDRLVEKQTREKRILWPENDAVR